MSEVMGVQDCRGKENTKLPKKWEFRKAMTNIRQRVANAMGNKALKCKDKEKWNVQGKRNMGRMVQY